MLNLNRRPTLRLSWPPLVECRMVLTATDQTAATHHSMALLHSTMGCSRHNLHTSFTNLGQFSLLMSRLVARIFDHSRLLLTMAYGVPSKSMDSGLGMVKHLEASSLVSVPPLSLVFMLSASDSSFPVCYNLSDQLYQFRCQFIYFWFRLFLL